MRGNSVYLSYQGVERIAVSVQQSSAFFFLFTFLSVISKSRVDVAQKFELRKACFLSFTRSMADT